MTDFFARFTGPAHALLRIAAGLLFIPHGAQKLFGWLSGPEGRSPALFPDLMWFAGVLEFFGGILIAAGWLTRPVAFLLSGQMLVAYFMAHAPKGALPILNRGELALLYCFIFLFLAAAGAGPWSIDSFLKKKSS
jgi:putative oxidoreductase